MPSRHTYAPVEGVVTSHLKEVPDMELDLRADLNCEDDDGLNWVLLSRAVHP